MARMDPYLVGSRRNAFGDIRHYAKTAEHWLGNAAMWGGMGYPADAERCRKNAALAAEHAFNQAIRLHRGDLAA